MTQTEQISGLIHSKKYPAELFMSMYTMGAMYIIQFALMQLELELEDFQGSVAL
jgi:hypothetical protein